jgi:thiol-disulfide isomerase/thioredoxin
MAALVLSPACSSKQSDPYVGNMDDFSYAGRRDKQYGPSASSGTVRLADFKGQYVWIDFAAPWCAPCRQQASIMRSIEKAYPGKVVFLTMMTSDNSSSSPATEHTARQWANQYSLDPHHVLPTTEWARRIPQHILFSPLGQTLEWKIGLMRDVQIKATLASHMRDWNRWYAENKDSPSVIMSEIGDLGDLSN